MSKRGICSGLLVAMALGVGALIAPEASAADSKVGGADKEIATKKGVKDSLATKEFDQDKLPGTLEIGLALGSIAAVVAAIKYL